MRQTRLRIGILILALMAGILGRSEAFWPFGRLLADDTPKEPLPPSAEAQKAECEPIRLKIVELNKANAVIHPFLMPQIGLLKRKYEKCMDRIREQEYKYLKHATIEIPPEKPKPDLPPMNPRPANPPENPSSKP